MQRKYASRFRTVIYNLYNITFHKINYFSKTVLRYELDVWLRILSELNFYKLLYFIQAITYK